MPQYKFTIHGNHENKKGNPLPKHRKTFRQQWTPEAKRYHSYLDYVRTTFLDAIGRRGRINAKEFQEHFLPGAKPLTTGKKKCRMEIFITWGSEAHGDPENIFGAIADAIFVQDKYLGGGIDFDPIVGDAGRVDVLITIGAEECGRARSPLYSRKGIKVAK